VKPLWLIGAIVVAAFLWFRRRKLGRLELGAGAVAVVAAAVYSTGLIHLPDVEHLVEDLGQALGPWTYLLVAVMAFCETGAFIGLIAPGETVILVGGLVAGQGQINIFVLIAIVWFCAVLGDVTSFVLGRRLGREFLVKHGPRFKITEDRLHTVERFFDRHGGKAILIGRFVGLIRAVAPFIAGSSGMPVRRFLPYDVIGAGLWGTTFCLLGYIFWQSFDQITNYASKGAVALGTVIVVVVGVVVAYRWLRVAENRTKAHKWLHEQAERPALRPLARVARPVVYRVIVPTTQKLTGPARFLWNRFTPGDLGLEVTTLLAVAAVGSFAFFALAFSVGPGEPLTFTDKRAVTIANDLSVGWGIDVAKAVTTLGTLPVVIGLCVVACLILARWKAWWGIAVLIGGTALVYGGVHITKSAVGRPRPEDSLVETSLSAYPSGHAAYAMAWVAVAVLLARVVPWLAGRAAVVVVAIAIAAAIGLSRVYLHAHWWSDVVGGWGLGASIYAVCGIFALLVAFIGKNRVSA
jgi:membrane protein DedA with SNARE-associated domain